MSKILAISGASHSGKTTLIEEIKSLYSDRIVVFGENIRRYKINIDEIRKKPYEYFKLQRKVIGKKIEQEELAKTLVKTKEYRGKLVIFDRSLIDSLFYLSFYVDKSSLSKRQLREYFKFLSYVECHVEKHYINLYDNVLFLEPIRNLERKDEFTQKELSHTQEFEYRFMKILSYGYDKNLGKLKVFNKLTDKKSILEFVHDEVVKCSKDK